MRNLKQYVLLVLMAVFVASLAVAAAQAQSTGVAVNVPFDFSVGSKHLSAGNYRIELGGAQHAFVAIFQQGGQTAYSIFNSGGYSADRNGQPYLVFVRSGAEAFLTKVVYSSTESYALPLSNRQREIMAQTSPVEMVDVSAGTAGSR